VSAMIAGKIVTTTSQERDTSLPWGSLTRSLPVLRHEDDEHEREGDEANDAAMQLSRDLTGGLDSSDWNEGSSFN
jgi:hypothetical protein